MTVASLRVELESFCQQFTAVLEPFSAALDQGTESLRDAAEASFEPLLNDVQDNRHRLKILLDRARQQHTYLVIFGPLKSGKSTLMNAISGAYVSEVTSLPAYPCLVYVKEGESHSFSSTAFNGDRSSYSSRDELHASLETAHAALAQRLREADAAGTAFNPAQDFTEAIRRIDFTMPAPFLRESGTILVDTPGLYTKMKYSYGQLTRDFRDTAACAVFVVKTDNLFYEQVFAEFADLLGVFSRVFLVVNIDSSKQDLRSDGSLQPALEQRDPKRILAAFENLTVSAQLRSAIDNGRLRIHLIDLLQSARRSLQAGQPLTPPAEASGPEGSAPTTAATEPQPGFDHFLQDLTDYLNSSEYIVEFMGDSLRQADSILHEVRGRVHAPEVDAYRAEIEALHLRTETSRQQLLSLQQLRRLEWSGALDELCAGIRQQVTEHSGSVLPELEKSLQREVEAWIGNDESMQDLVEHRIGSKILELCQHARARAIDIFDRACRDRNSGIRIEGAVRSRLQELELSFEQIYPAFQPRLRQQLEATPELPSPAGLQQLLPLRRRWLDWLLCRSDARVRQHLFGSDNPSARPFSAKAKARRLSEEGIHEFCCAAGDYARQCNLIALHEVLENLFREYREAFQADSSQQMEARQQERQREFDAVTNQLEQRQQVLQRLDQLDAACDELEGEIGQLQGRFIPHRAVFDLRHGEDRLESRPASSESPEDSTNA